MKNTEEKSKKITGEILELRSDKKKREEREKRKKKDTKDMRDIEDTKERGKAELNELRMQRYKALELNRQSLRN